MTKPTDSNQATAAKLPSRRELAGLLGAGLGAAALSACAEPAVMATQSALSTAGSLQWCDTMADLKALAGSSYQTVMLAGYWANGDGGGGLFIWDPASTLADDGGTVIQPALATGAGRWLRLVANSTYNVKWFGAPGSGGVAVGASPSGAAADDAGVQLALTAIRQITYADAALKGSNNADGATLYFPHGMYRLTQTILLDRCIALKGDYQSGWASSAYLQWAPSTPAAHGIVVQGTGTLTPNRGDCSVIEGLWIIGGSASPSKIWTAEQLDDAITSPGSSMFGNQPACGVCIFANGVRVKDCYFANWDGDAIHVEGVTSDKNANDWHVQNVEITNCGRHGVFSAGNNSSGGLGEHILGTGSLGGYTVYDRSFLGNTYLACHSEGATHSYYSQEGVANCTFIGCYQEASDGPALLGSNTVVIGGVWGNGILGTPVLIASVPGSGTGVLRGVVKSPQAPPIRRYTPAVPYDVEGVDVSKDHTIIIDNSAPSGPFYHTMVVPLPTLAAGYEYTLKRIDSNTGYTTTIVCNAPGYKFEGVQNGSYLLDAGHTVTIQNDGTDWFVISKL